MKIRHIIGNDIYDFLRNILLPYLFCLLLSASVLEAYDIGGASVYTLCSAVFCAVLVFVFRLMLQRKLIGTPAGYYLYAVLSVITLVMLVRLSESGGYGEWFYYGGEGIATTAEYGFITVLSFSFFFCSAGYYFTSVLYRGGFLLLLSLIPCVLYVKIVNNISSIYLALIIALNIIFMILDRYDALMEKSGPEINEKKQLSSGAGIVFGAFLTAAVVMQISAVIPRPTETKYYDTFERLFSIGGSRNSGSDFSSFNDISGDASMYNQLRNMLIYRVHADEVIYARRQWFDSYSAEDNAWLMTGASWNDNRNFENAGLLSYDRLLAAYHAAAEIDGGFAERHGLTELLSSEKTEFDKVKVARLYNAGMPIYYYMPTTRTISLNSFVGEPISIQPNGRVPSGYGRAGYEIQYYEEVASAIEWRAAGGMNMSMDEFVDTIFDALLIIANHLPDSEHTEVLSAFNSEISNALIYSISTEDDISSEIEALALEVTAGCTTDYEKAEALRLFFDEGGFVYSVDYTPPDNSIEYFIFNSRRGSCSEYATAYVLMARAAGLISRYCEGFVSDISVNSDYPFQIRTTSSHAYPEVYIPGAGWIIFEPTPAAYRSNLNDIDRRSQQGNAGIDKSILRAVTAAACAGAAALVIWLFMPLITETIFRIKVKRFTPERAIVLIYNRLLYRMDSGNISPRELISAAMSRCGKDISFTVILFEKICYGGGDAAEEDKERAMSEYLSVAEALRQRNKKA